MTKKYDKLSETKPLTYKHGGLIIKTLYILFILSLFNFQIVIAQKTEIGIIGGITKNHIRYTNPVPVSCFTFGTPKTPHYGIFLQHSVLKKWDVRLVFRKVILKNTSSTCPIKVHGNSTTSQNYSVSTFSPFRTEISSLFHLGKRQKPHFIFGTGIIYECAWKLASQTSQGIYDGENTYFEIKETNHHLQTNNFLIQGILGFEIPEKKYNVTIELLYQKGFVDTYQYDYYLRFSKTYDDYLKTSKIFNGSNLMLQVSIRRPWRMKPKKDEKV